MPILEKTPPKMAAKSPSSEEEPVSDVWSSLSHPCSPYSEAFASRTFLSEIDPQHLPDPQSCTLLCTKSTLQSCPKFVEEPRRAWRVWE